MKVKQNVKGFSYEKLIEYAIKINDVISVTYRPNQHEKELRKEIDKLSELGISKKYIINNYSDEFIGLFFEKYKNNETIFDKEYTENYERNIYNASNYKEFKLNREYKNQMVKKYEKFGIKLSLNELSYDDYKKIIVYDYRLNYICSIFKRIFYDYTVNNFLNKYKRYIIHEEKSIYKNITVL